ncbi:MAG TPA: hypothetical protein V6C57_15345, partial [Coleofasciculaceae cyanobacterium]
FNQLEFAHQANQRQQILVETLTGQIESSQERVAELEREAALIQQRYNEQAQLLSQLETTNRDLQARLHRQQRYTLQFKAALEKCLEVPTPQYDLGLEAAAAAGDNPFLFKTQRIQPWSSEAEAAPARFPWMKLYPHNLDEQLGDEAQPVATPLAQEPVTAAQSPAQLESNLKLPIVEPLTAEPAIANLVAEPEVDLPAVSLRAEATESAEPSGAPALVNPTLKSQAGLPVPLRKVDDAVRPLADLLAEAVNGVIPAAPTPDLSPAPSASLPEPALPLATSEHPEDAEDALWQDLARLIEVSTEDVVRASLSGDFSAFEAIDFGALESGGAAPVAANVPQSSMQPFQTEAALPQSELPSEPIPEENPADASASDEHSPIPALSQPSWPAPVVYPLRPAKKQRSSGAVDLPSFLRPGTNPLAT